MGGGLAGEGRGGENRYLSYPVRRPKLADHGQKMPTQEGTRKTEGLRKAEEKISGYHSRAQLACCVAQPSHQTTSSENTSSSNCRQQTRRAQKTRRAVRTQQCVCAEGSCLDEHGSCRENERRSGKREAARSNVYSTLVMIRETLFLAEGRHTLQKLQR